jgi:RHS repeat-associated protein
LGIDNKLKMVTNGVSKYFLQDHLGSTTALTNSSGSVIESATYDSFGNATGNLSTRYQFTGREYDNAIGLTYYRARWYSSELGRFVSEDPIGFGGGDVNLFGYVKNRPLMFKDPTGLVCYPILNAILGAQVGGVVGAASGAVIGGAVAGAGLAVAGGGLGTLAFPGGGTVAGGAVGGGIGIGGGAIIGAGIGGAIGAVAGGFIGYNSCPPTECDTTPKAVPRVMPRDPSKEDDCYNRCSHLLPSPSGDLQSSEFRKCYRECMGSL